nr:hypothetical protein [uncultured Sphingosinicella sp.]
MAYLGIVLSAFLMTMTVGAISKFAIRTIQPAKPASFGAFCLTLGFAGGHYGGSAEFGPEVSGAGEANPGLAGPVVVVV